MNASTTSRQPVRVVRIVAIVAVLMLLLAACGQKPEVRIASDAVGQGGGAAGTGGGTGEGGDADFLAGAEGGGNGDAAGGGGGQVAGGQGAGGDGGTGGTGGDGGTTAGGQTGEAGQAGGDGGGGEGGQQAQGQRQPQGSDQTGLTDDKITLGLHAPVTGAAPLPVTSFEKSGDLYWRWIIDTQEQTVLGRTEVELIFRDDKYDPNSAIQVCRELAAETFFLVGGGGTDQIQACGRFANQSSVPYFSAGVTERGLRGLPWYFASSMSYKAQGQQLLAPYVKKEFGDAKVAAVVTDTPNFDDAVEGWEAGVQQQGIDYYKTLRHPKGDNSWYNSFVSELKRNDVDVVYPLTSPVDYIRFAQQASEQNYSPQWVGVGITMALNAVLGSGCDHVDGGRFFSPFPGLDWARDNEPDFFEAGREHDAPTDDIALALWGTAKAQHVLFQRYGEVFGNQLTREDFRAVVEQQQNVESGVFPTVSYSPEDHFGADTAHLLEADCDEGEHVTLATFVSGF